MGLGFYLRLLEGESKTRESRVRNSQIASMTVLFYERERERERK